MREGREDGVNGEGEGKEGGEEGKGRGRQEDAKSGAVRTRQLPLVFETTVKIKEGIVAVDKLTRKGLFLLLDVVVEGKCCIVLLACLRESVSVLLSGCGLNSLY